MSDDTSGTAGARDEAINGIDRLCETFDPLLDNPAHVLYPHQRSELAAMARIFDLSTSREPAEVWSDLRTMLVVTPGSRDAEPAEIMTIMVVEDDADGAERIMSTLAEAGHRLVGPFESAAAAEVSAALHQVDLALIDINLASQANGVDLSQSLKTRWAVPTILMSSDATTLAAVGNLGDGIVLKPFTTKALQDAVDDVVRGVS